MRVEIDFIIANKSHTTHMLHKLEWMNAISDTTQGETGDSGEE
jgi:hypothetical protein